MPTSKSATARETMKKLVTVRSLDDVNTLTMTRILPAITKMLIKTSTITEMMTVASLNFIAILVHIAAGVGISLKSLF